MSVMACAMKSSKRRASSNVRNCLIHSIILLSAGLFLTVLAVLKNSAGSYHRSEVGDQGYPTLRFASPASSYLAFAVLTRPVALLLVAALTFFLDEVRVDVFFVVDGRAGFLLLLVFSTLAVACSSAVEDSSTFSL